MSGWKNSFYKMLVKSGLTHISAYLNRHKLVILCLHSLSLKDEHLFWPGVFISRDRLIPILEFLKHSRYNVISLEEALRHLQGEVTHEYPVVITIDDGWWASVAELLPVLEDYEFPSTTYVTTYYCDHQIAVVNVLLQYWLWKKPVDTISLSFNGKDYQFAGSSNSELVKKIESSIREFDDQEKMAFLAEIADFLGQDKADLTDRRFHNASYDELARVVQNPLHSIQLHTHTHRLPEDAAGIQREIGINREKLTASLKPPYGVDHLCYPSGIWQPGHIPDLEALGVRTATTLDEGLNHRGEHSLKLKRNLVMDNRSLDQLKVTMSGIMDMARGLKQKL